MGIDPDPDILAIAKEKASQVGAEIELEVGFADRLPGEDGRFDHVVSTLAFHHLTRREKQDALGEAFRVLKPGGRLHILDVCQPRGLLMRALTLPLARDERTADNRAGLVPRFIAEAGFTESSDDDRPSRAFGTVCLHHARKPAATVGC